MNLTALRGWLAVCALLPLAAAAIPIEVHEQDLALTVPDGFEEMAPLTNDPDVVRLFIRRPSTTGEPDTWLSIRRIEPPGPASEWHPDVVGSNDIMGRYSERLHDFDVDVIQSRLNAEDAVYRGSRARLPGDSASYQVDLVSRSMEDQEMKTLMRTVLASASAAEEQTASFTGWGAMFLCLTLGAALIVLAFARR